MRPNQRYYYYVDWKLRNLDNINFMCDTNLLVQCNGDLRKPAPPNMHLEVSLHAALAIQRIDFAYKELDYSNCFDIWDLSGICHDLVICYCRVKRI